MMTNLSWSALILAALAAVACWIPEDQPDCDEVRPVFGARVCCERHRAGGLAVFSSVAELEAARRAETSPLVLPGVEAGPDPRSWRSPLHGEMAATARGGIGSPNPAPGSGEKGEGGISPASRPTFSDQ
jgi:hypothetical protein